MTATKRQRTAKNTPIVINFFEQPVPNTQASGSWAYPGSTGAQYKKLDYWIDLAKRAEAAKVNAIFLADVLGPYDVYKGPENFKTGVKAGNQHPGIAPETAISAMAAVTKNVGFGITFSTISEHPYLFARRLASLDHLTDGRVAWNIVNSYLQSGARNLLNGAPLPPGPERYERTEEYVQVVTELLLSSFRADANKEDAETQTYIDPDLVRKINFKGKFFEVPGPGYTEPSPQGIPVLIQAGSSLNGMELSAKAAEIVFTTGATLEGIKKKVETVKTIAKEKYNRDPNNLKVLTFAMVIVGETTEEAWKKFENYSKYTNKEGALALFGGWMGVDLSIYDDDVDLTQVDNIEHREKVKTFCAKILHQGPINKEKFAHFVSVKGLTDLFIGSVQEVADEIQEWVEVGGLDGFNFAPTVTPQSFEELTDLVLPELRKRGLVWGDYPVKGGTYRENLYGIKGQKFLFEEHPLHGFRWTEGTDEEFTSKSNELKKKLSHLSYKKIEGSVTSLG